MNRFSIIFISLVYSVANVNSMQAQNIKIHNSINYNASNLAQIFTNGTQQEQLDVIKHIKQEYESDTKFSPVADNMFQAIMSADITKKYLNTLKYCVNNNILQPETQDKILESTLEKLYNWIYRERQRFGNCIRNSYNSLYYNSDMLMRAEIQCGNVTGSFANYMLISRIVKIAYDDCMKDINRSDQNLKEIIDKILSDVENRLRYSPSISKSEMFSKEFLEKRYRTYEKFINGLPIPSVLFKKRPIRQNIKAKFTQGDIQKLFDKKFG